MIHLTLTGYHAGEPLCGKQRTADHEYHHPNVRALRNPDYRARVCPDCLSIWESDDEGDDHEDK